MSLRIVVAGGGTGGHIEPALALADAVLRLDPSATVTALGTARGLETTLVPARGYPLALIPAASLPRRLTPDLLRVPGRMRAAVRAAAEVLTRVDAQAVVGFGGYVALPAYLAARRLGIPFAVHEANARPGLANRIAARMTDNVYTASPAIKLRHAHPIGMPLRRSITTLDRAGRRAGARGALGLDPDRPTLLVTGGSQGAQSINAAALGAAAALADAGIQVLHIAGPKNDLAAPSVAAGAAPYVLVPFLDGLADAYAAADFVLCRCGAMTCAELTALGLPAAYVPYPHGNGEQRLNAEPIVAAGGGLLVADADCTPDWIASSVIPVLGDAGRLTAMSAAAAGSGAKDADEVLARAVLRLAAGHAAGPTAAGPTAAGPTAAGPTATPPTGESR